MMRRRGKERGRSGEYRVTRRAESVKGARGMDDLSNDGGDHRRGSAREQR